MDISDRDNAPPIIKLADPQNPLEPAKYPFHPDLLLSWRCIRTRRIDWTSPILLILFVSLACLIAFLFSVLRPDAVIQRQL